MHVKEDTCTDGVHPSYYFRLRAVRAYSALSLIHRRSKVTSIQSRGIGFSKPILCIRKFWSFCASCSHPRWKKSITLPFLCKILDCSGYTHICLGEADACSCGQENDQPNVALLLASVVVASHTIGSEDALTEPVFRIYQCVSLGAYTVQMAA